MTNEDRRAEIAVRLRDIKQSIGVILCLQAEIAESERMATHPFAPPQHIASFCSDDEPPGRDVC